MNQLEAQGNFVLDVTVGDMLIKTFRLLDYKVSGLTYNKFSQTPRIISAAFSSNSAFSMSGKYGCMSFDLFGAFTHLAHSSTGFIVGGSSLRIGRSIRRCR